MPEADDRVVRNIRAMAEDAAAYAVASLYANHPEMQQQFTQRGWEHCRADALTHLDVLCAAVALGRDEPFEQYSRWLAAHFEARRLPGAWIDQSFGYLSEYLLSNLGEPEGERAAEVFKAARSALALAGPGRDYPRNPVAPLRGADVLAQALVKGDAHTTQGFHHRLGPDGSGYTELCVRIVQPAMYEIGQWWQETRISVAEEHLATASAERILDQAYACAHASAPTHRCGLFACVEGNGHALGLRMVADSFELSGWSTQYLGADVPIEALLAQVDSWRPDLVGLSASMPQQLPALKNSIERLRHELGSGCPTLMVGGIVVNALGEAWRLVGADLTAADAQLAVAVARPEPARYAEARHAIASATNDAKKMAKCAQDQKRYLEAKPSGSRSEIR